MVYPYLAKRRLCLRIHSRKGFCRMNSNRISYTAKKKPNIISNVFKVCLNRRTEQNLVCITTIITYHV